MTIRFVRISRKLRQLTNDGQAQPEAEQRNPRWTLSRGFYRVFKRRHYVDRDDYNHYFREGFRRGYEDGYSSRYQYGRYANGAHSILDAILAQVLGFQSLR